MGQSDSEQRVGELAADVILGSGRPVLTVPGTGKFGELSGQIVVGWDGSREAARAVFDALPLLKKAKGVSIVTVREGGEVKDTLGTGGADMALTLSRHGVKVEAVSLNKNDRSVGDTLLEYTSSQDGDLLVMGCYSHSRLRERLFGGATQHLLRNMIAPVLMSH
jgi:nucleotide-binding universal stress UspA family protein